MRFKLLGILAAAALLAPTPSMGQGPERPNVARNGPAARPQTSTSRVARQANPRATTPSLSQARTAERSRPDRRRGNERAAGQRNQRATQALDQAASRGANPNGLQRRPGDPRLRGSESPRQAMERGLRQRLSQIDKIRDRAIDTGDLDLLDVADRLELDARRKVASMIERIDARQQAGLPGVGPVLQSPRRNDNLPREPRVTRVPDVVNQNQDPAPATPPNTSDQP
jgi:hypothetical protein